MKQSKLTGLAVLFVLTGCAEPIPMPFQMVDEHSTVYTGIMRAADRSMDITLVGVPFRGFYIVASTTAVSTYDQPFFKRWGPAPMHSVSTVSSNSAKAVLIGDDKTRLTCDFLFQGVRSIGECKTAAGKTYQFMAGID